jgi:hypothetical protein
MYIFIISLICYKTSSSNTLYLDILEYLFNSTDHEAPNYAFMFILLLLPPFQIQIFSSAPWSQAAYVLLGLVTGFPKHAHQIETGSSPYRDRPVSMVPTREKKT